MGHHDTRARGLPGRRTRGRVAEYHIPARAVAGRDAGPHHTPATPLLTRLTRATDGHTIGRSTTNTYQVGVDARAATADAAASWDCVAMAGAACGEGQAGPAAGSSHMPGWEHGKGDG